MRFEELAGNQPLKDGSGDCAVHAEQSSDQRICGVSDTSHLHDDTRCVWAQFLVRNELRKPGTFPWRNDTIELECDTKHAADVRELWRVEELRRHFIFDSVYAEAEILS
jgi:hypothetical protein